MLQRRQSTLTVMDAWLDIKQPAEAAYLAATQHNPQSQHYFCLTDDCYQQLQQATEQLHQCFMQATDYVLAKACHLQTFNIPPLLWPKLQESWKTQQNAMLSGRFDFCLSEQGLKVYEYNADSAFGLLECSTLQQKWADVAKIGGKCPGATLFPQLVNAWRHSQTHTLIHILQDFDSEEDYHALHMKTAIEASGKRCTILRGLSELSWQQDDVIDAKGQKLQSVWKTWAWESVIQQIRSNPAILSNSNHHQQTPYLAEILLHPAIQVLQPLWTLIPSNKAILPILWQLFPNHPYLLPASYTLTRQLQASGYSIKPIAGRCGANIQLIDHDAHPVATTSGQFYQQPVIYQAYYPLPKIAEHYVQLFSFTVNGYYAGAGARVSPHVIVTEQSDILPLRIIKS